MAGRLAGSLSRLLGLVGISFALIEACSLDVGGLPGGAGGASTGGLSAMSAASAGGAPDQCGDGVRSPREACDDGNTDPADGCSPTCSVENADTCPGLALPLGTAGLTLPGDLTGRADDLHPGCGTPDSGDVVYAVTPNVTGTLTVTLSGQGAFHKSLSLRSVCAVDSPVAELDCAANETAEALVLHTWVLKGMTYEVLVDGDPQAFALTLGLSECGNGVREELEECDGEVDCKGCVTCAGTGEFWDAARTHCYRFVEPGASWVDARKGCVAWGGDLAGIATQVELNELAAHPFNAPFLWTAGYALSPDCTFAWADAEPWFQDSWRQGDPDDVEAAAFCVALARPAVGPYQMIDDACSNAYPYLCERTPAKSCGDGILQPGEQCDDATAPPGTCSQCRSQCLKGEFQDPFTHHCYRLITGQDAQDWNTARVSCSTKGGYLATITSAEENALVASNLNGEAWLGGRWTPSNAERWDDQERFCFKGWGATQPAPGAGDCIAIQPDGTWANQVCGKPKDYVCERSP